MGDAGHKSQPPKGQRKQTDLEGNGKQPTKATRWHLAYSSIFQSFYPSVPRCPCPFYSSMAILYAIIHPASPLLTDIWVGASLVLQTMLQ